MDDISDDKSKQMYKSICLRIPKEMLDRIDISAKNTRGYNRTTWMLQALDQKLKSGDDISNIHMQHISNDDGYLKRTIDLDKKIIARYAEDMKSISKKTLIKILSVSILVAAVAGCCGGAAGSVFSIWSATSGVSGESLRTHEVCSFERETLVKEIKQEVIKDLLEKPTEILEMPQSLPIEPLRMECFTEQGAVG